MPSIGVVIIGRNEGERLKNSIRSLTDLDLKIVYVDSDSSDGSVEFVKNQGYDVVELDMSLPFSAGRARNEGYRHLLASYENIEFIQFIDGDCEICDGWLSTAQQFLLDHPELASVCGRRKERFPDKTLYNKICDIEWNTPIGRAKATGGDFMCRAKAIIDVDGFNPQVIAGEEPEMCFRMRQQGWQMERLDADMTLHDANMTSIKQWWKRSERSGHAYAQGYFMHGKSSEKYNQKDVLRIVIWALAIPVFILLTAIIVSPWLLLLLLIYPVKMTQIALKETKKYGTKIGIVYSILLILGKFPQLKGVLSFVKKHLSGQKFEIIEYKSP